MRVPAVRVQHPRHEETSDSFSASACSEQLRKRPRTIRSGFSERGNSKEEANSKQLTKDVPAFVSVHLQRIRIPQERPATALLACRFLVHDRRTSDLRPPGASWPSCFFSSKTTTASTRRKGVPKTACAAKATATGRDAIPQSVRHPHSDAKRNAVFGMTGAAFRQNANSSVVGKNLARATGWTEQWK